MKTTDATTAPNASANTEINSTNNEASGNTASSTSSSVTAIIPRLNFPVAIAGNSGSGKSTLFKNSRYIGTYICADPGSAQMQRHLPPGCRFVRINSTGICTNPDGTTYNESPIRQILRAAFAKGAGNVVVDNLLPSAYNAEITWQKIMVNKPPLTKNGAIDLRRLHQEVQGRFMDLSSKLADINATVLFNLSPGGMQKVQNEAGTEAIHIPAGAIVGPPALSGTDPSKQTLLAGYAYVFIVWPGGPGTRGEAPRGVILPNKDDMLRTTEARNLAPSKDGMILKPRNQGDLVWSVPDFREFPDAQCPFDEIVDLLQ